MTTSLNELNLLRQHIEELKSKLSDSIKLELPAYKDFLKENIDDLDKVLEVSKTPDYYKVAIVGRFKVGKSSFVNALTTSKLAGVSTNPETAAISVFRYSESTYAEIDIISKEKWQALQKEDDKRYSGFTSFNEKHKDKKEKFVLADIETKYIKEGGFSHRIDAVNWSSKDGQKNFLKEIKQFTSSQSPLHYLVNQIVIYVPIPLLGEQIELIDTPGLDDTEIFRVILTEEKVKDVDAILFLTASGASYSQSDKDFLIRQLRSRQIKQLQIVVTKIDDTYESKKRHARDDDDEIPTLEAFKREEELRIRKEIKATLDELLTGQTNDEEGYYYMEQLDSIPIHFISTHYYDDGDHEKSGLPKVKEQLNKVLSSSSRFVQSRKALVECSERVLNKIESSFENRLDAIDSNYNAEKVQNELQKIREQLEEELNTFKKKLDNPLNEMSKAQSSFAKHLPTYLDKTDILARGIIESSRNDDLIRHWRSKRSGNWGYIYGIGNSIADRIFPTVESILNEYVEHLNTYLNSITIELNHLEQQIQIMEEKNKLSGVKALSLADCQKTLGKRIITESYVNSSKDSIVKNLDEFTNDAIEKLELAREAVSDIAGKGTSVSQNSTVKTFYNQIQKVLSETLRNHLEERIKSFAQSLLEQAEGIKPKIERELMAELDSRVLAIQSNIAFTNAKEKEKVQQYLSDMITWCNEVKETILGIKYKV